MWRSIHLSINLNGIVNQKRFIKNIKPQKTGILKICGKSHFSVIQYRFSSSIPKDQIPNIDESGISNVTQGILDSEPLIKLLDPSQYNNFYDPIVYFSEFLLDSIRISTGMPWVPSIVSFALIIRLLSVPLLTRSFKYTICNFYFNRMKEHINDEHKSKDVLDLLKKELKFTMIPRPIIIGAITSLYTVGFLGVGLLSFNTKFPIIYNGLKDTSFMWIDSLTMMDPYYILPCISILSTLFAYSIKGISFKHIGVALTFFTLSYTLPSSIHLFWAALGLSHMIIEPYISHYSFEEFKRKVINVENKYPHIKELNKTVIS